MIPEERNGELVISWFLTDKLGILSQSDNKKVSTGCLNVCKNNVHNSEQ